MSKELQTFIERSLERGVEKDVIRDTLVASGWSGKVVDKILMQYAGISAQGLVIPAPRMQSHQIAQDLFLYLLSLVTLGITAFATGSLLFAQINHLLVDPTLAMRDRQNDWSINLAIAEILIAFPLYTWLAVHIGRDVERSPQKRESLIRKLMIYLILVISAITAIGDLIAVLTQLLSGEMTLRFLAKALVVLGISLIIFIFYLYEVKKDDALVRERLV